MHSISTAPLTNVRCLLCSGLIMLGKLNLISYKLKIENKKTKQNNISGMIMNKVFLQTWYIEA